MQKTILCLQKLSDKLDLRIKKSCELELINKSSRKYYLLKHLKSDIDVLIFTYQGKLPYYMKKSGKSE